MLATLNPSPPDVLEPVGQGDSAPMTADAAFKSDFLRTLRDRGYIHQITHPDELDAAASTGVVHHSLAIIIETVGPPPAGRRQVELVVALPISTPDKGFETGRPPQLIGA